MNNPLLFRAALRAADTMRDAACLLPISSPVARALLDEATRLDAAAISKEDRPARVPPLPSHTQSQRAPGLPALPPEGAL